MVDRWKPTEVGCQGGRAGVPSWYQLTDPIWNSRDQKAVKLTIWCSLGTPSEAADVTIVRSDLMYFPVMNKGLLS